jgi:hypothetical protein
MRPVVSEISDLELEHSELRPKKKKGLLVAFAAVLVLGGAAFGVTKSGLLPQDGSMPVTASVAAAANPVQAATPTPTTQLPSNPAPTSTYDLAGLSAAPSGPARLSDEQRRALLETDKAREAKHKARATSSPRHGGSSHPRKNEPSPFHKGGDPHDPLNSSL